MTNEALFDKTRRIMGEVDLVTSYLTNEELLAAISDACDVLVLRGNLAFEGFSFGFVQNEPGYGITPEPSLQVGTVLALKASAALLRRTYGERVTRGEIGVSWQSALESESSLQAGREYLAMIDRIEDDADRLLLIMNADRAGRRVQ